MNEEEQMTTEAGEGLRIFLMIILAFAFGYFLRGDIIYSGMFKNMSKLTDVVEVRK